MQLRCAPVSHATDVVAKPMLCWLLQLGVESLCQAVEGNFLSMPFPEATFDGAYAIEATCHADKVSIILQQSCHQYTAVDQFIFQFVLQPLTSC